VKITYEYFVYLCHLFLIFPLKGINGVGA